MSSVVDRAYAFVDAALDQPRHELILRMSLFVLLLGGTSNAIVDVVLRVSCGLMIIAPGLLQNRWLWLLTLLAMSYGSLPVWYALDNHKILIFYWTGVCTMAVWSRRPDAVLAWNGRVLVALAFTFATAWKFLGGEYLDGRFFTYELLLDSRFSAFTSLVTSISPVELASNAELLHLIRAFPDQGLNLQMSGVDAIRPVALAMSYSTILIEGAIAVAFLWSVLRKHSEVADWILIAFTVFTYTLTPVIGFGYILIVMGAAQCPSEYRDARLGCIWAFALVQFASISVFRVTADLLETY